MECTRVANLRPLCGAPNIDYNAGWGGFRVKLEQFLRANVVQCSTFFPGKIMFRKIIRISVNLETFVVVYFLIKSGSIKNGL